MKENQFIIYLEMYLYKAKKLIIKRDCTSEDLNEAEAYLNKCRDLAFDSESRIDVWFGKLELKRSKLSNDNLDKKIKLNSAKNSFFAALSKKITPSAYYGLFKVAIAEEDWSSAKAYLAMYEKSGRKKQYNFVLAHKMLDACLGGENDTSFSKSDYIFANKIDYAPLTDNYHLAEEAFRNRQYNSCLKHLLICQRLATVKNIAIDFSQLIIMITSIIEKKNVTVIDELQAKILNTENKGERIILIRKLLKLTPQVTNLYFLLIDSYLELGAYSCIPEILEDVVKYNLSEIDVKRVKYYENLFKEQQQYDKNMISIFLDLQEGDEKATKGEFYQAYLSYFNCLQKSGYPLLLSKIGDLFYVNGYYKQAQQYYSKYLSNGYENRFNVYINLYKTHKRLNDSEQALLVAQEAFGDLFLEVKGYKLESWLLKLESEYNKELTGDESIKVKELMQLPVQLS